MTEHSTASAIAHGHSTVSSPEPCEPIVTFPIPSAAPCPSHGLQALAVTKYLPCSRSKGRKKKGFVGDKRNVVKNKQSIE